MQLSHSIEIVEHVLALALSNLPVTDLTPGGKSISWVSRNSSQKISGTETHIDAA